MVQLKDELFSKRQLDAIFQFLYGTIKSGETPTHTQDEILFQFLYGTIKRRENKLPKLEEGISIPLWYN